jgi:hypothetical protein
MQNSFMKKLCFFSAVFFIISSCGNSASNDAAGNTGGDSVGLTNPSSIDTVKHPGGMINSSVISTDTAAINVQNTFKKADSIAKARNR